MNYQEACAACSGQRYAQAKTTGDHNMISREPAQIVCTAPRRTKLSDTYFEFPDTSTVIMLREPVPSEEECVMGTPSCVSCSIAKEAAQLPTGYEARPYSEFGDLVDW